MHKYIEIIKKEINDKDPDYEAGFPEKNTLKTFYYVSGIFDKPNVNCEYIRIYGHPL